MTTTDPIETLALALADEYGVVMFEDNAIALLRIIATLEQRVAKLEKQEEATKRLMEHHGVV